MQIHDDIKRAMVGFITLAIELAGYALTYLLLAALIK